MISPRWNKIIRDLAGQKARTVLVVCAIAVGVAAFGSVFLTNDILLANMDRAYRVSRPSTIQMSLSGFDESLVSWVRRQPGVSEASGKANRTVTIHTPGGKEERMGITSVPDFDVLALNTLIPKKGTWPPPPGELVLERASVGASGVSVGDTVTVEDINGRLHRLVLSGTVYDNSAIPYMFTQQMTGFVSWETLALLGFPKQFTKLEIATSSDIRTLADAEKLTFDLSETLKDRGVIVLGTMVSKPNQHWAVDNSKAFTAILSVMGTFSLILSGFLVINTITALLAQQKKQIGIMKAIGGKNSQLLVLYLSVVVVYGLLALIVALPVGIGIGYVFVMMVMNFLNLEVYMFYLPPAVFLMQLVTAILVPIIAATLPIFGAIRSSVREAISDTSPAKRTGTVEHVLSRIGGLPRTLLISLRNTFRKKMRLTLTMGTLVVAGAVFMAVVNDRTAMMREMERILSMFDFEVSVAVAKDQHVSSVVSRLRDLPHVVAVEGRTGTSAQRVKDDGTKGDRFEIMGLPPETPFSNPVMLAGRWLTPTDTYQVVVSSGFVRNNSDITVGTDLPISIDTDIYHLEVVGINAMSGDQKVGFLNFTTVAAMKDAPGLASSYMIKTSPDDSATQDAVVETAKERLERSNITVGGTQTRHQIFDSAAGQFNFMVFFLLAMAVLIAIVGGLGLTGTVSLNVLERTREIGIMRSIGAGDSAILRLVMTEGLFMGLMSWALSIPLSFLLTYGLGYAIGSAFFERTLVFVIEPTGILLWLIIVVIIAVGASFFPSRRASRMSIGDTLAYE